MSSFVINSLTSQYNTLFTLALSVASATQIIRKYFLHNKKIYIHMKLSDQLLFNKINNYLISTALVQII